MQNSNYCIRLARDSDVQAILDIYAPYILNSTTSFETEVPTLELFAARIEKVMKEAPWLVYTFDDQLAGYAYATEHRSRQAYQFNRELSVYVSDNFKNQSIGSALYQTLIEILKLQGYANVLAGITLPNEVSVQFHKRMGFTYVGVYHNVGYKFGKYIDVSWWELKIRDKIPEQLIHYSNLDQDLFSSCLQNGVRKIKNNSI